MNFASSFRRRVLFSIITGYVVLVVFQLFVMQILDNLLYDEKSRGNSIEAIQKEAPRGILFDRNLDVLVGNKPSFTLQIIPFYYNRSLNTVIEKVIGADAGYIEKILKLNENYSKYNPVKIRRNIDMKVVSWLEENSEKLPGVEFVVDVQRDYSNGVTGSHAFGYVKEITSAQLKQLAPEYIMGDNIGHAGIEKTYEKYLRGEKGYNYYLVDARRRIIGKLNKGKEDKTAVKGKDLIVTLDLETQKAAEEALRGKTGSVIAIEPATGEILAFVSAPDFDLDKFTSYTTRDFLDSLQDDPKKPLFNRVCMSIYSPGSTYKMMVAAAGLETGTIDEKTIYSCPGGYTLGGRLYKCMHIHGSVDVLTSIEKSCNTFYYRLAINIGLANWHDYSYKLGFGHKTGLDIGGEINGLAPDKAYYDRAFGKGRWKESGMVINLGIGQGELSVTPLQLAHYAAMLANYGTTYAPHLARGYIDTRKKRVVKFDFKKVDSGISRKTFELIREGMRRVVEGYGTARHIKIEGIEIAGKTGTAQNPHGENHALFIGFAPFDNPKIAVAVIVENAGFGGTHAAPVAKRVFETYLSKEHIIDEEAIFSIFKEE